MQTIAAPEGLRDCCASEPPRAAGAGAGCQCAEPGEPSSVRLGLSRSWSYSDSEQVHGRVKFGRARPVSSSESARGFKLATGTGKPPQLGPSSAY